MIVSYNRKLKKKLTEYCIVLIGTYKVKNVKVVTWFR